MKFNKKNAAICAALALGMASFLAAPISQAGWAYHPWHWKRTIVKYRGCRRIKIRISCHRNWQGFRVCRRVRRVRRIC